MDKKMGSGILVAIGVLIMFAAGIPENLSFNEIRDSIIGLLFIIIGISSYIKFFKEEGK